MILGTGTLAVLKLLGGVAFLLWGLRMVRTGATRALGGNLRRLAARAAGNRVTALMSGMGLAMLVQSSTAVVLLVAAFAARGTLGVVPGMAMALGADVGTTVAAQVLSFDLGVLGPILAFIGVVLFASLSDKRGRNIGRILIGLALMLLALKLIVAASSPMREAAVIQALIAALAGEPLLAVVLAALLTWLSHSSLAMVLLVMSLATAGQVPVSLAVVLVLGINLGGTLPAIVATLGGGAIGRRVALGNLVFRLVGVVVLLPLLDPIQALLSQIDADPARQVANMHTLFNLVVAAVFIFLLTPMATLAARLLPVTPAQSAAEVTPLYLDQARRSAPSSALSSAAREASRMGDVVFEMLSASLKAFDTDDPEVVKAIERMDDTVDQLNEAIKFYLTDISRQPLSEAESHRCMQIFNFVINIEHIGDIIDKNLMDLAARKLKRKVVFSREGAQEIARLHARLVDNLQLSLTLFMSLDEDLAEQMLAEKKAFRDREREATERHLDRLRRGYAESIETSAIHLDLLRDFKRINSHITALAYTVLEGGPEMTPGDDASAEMHEEAPHADRSTSFGR